MAGKQLLLNVAHLSSCQSICEQLADWRLALQHDKVTPQYCQQLLTASVRYIKSSGNLRIIFKK